MATYARRIVKPSFRDADHKLTSVSNLCYNLILLYVSGWVPPPPCEDPRPHAWSMCAACFCPCISLSRATPLGRSLYQTLEFPAELLTRTLPPPQPLEAWAGG